MYTQTTHAYIHKQHTHMYTQTVHNTYTQTVHNTYTQTILTAPYTYTSMYMFNNDVATLISLERKGRVRKRPWLQGLSSPLNSKASSESWKVCRGFHEKLYNTIFEFRDVLPYTRKF